jgi:hypothetical protein
MQRVDDTHGAVAVPETIYLYQLEKMLFFPAGLNEAL